MKEKVMGHSKRGVLGLAMTFVFIVVAENGIAECEGQREVLVVGVNEKLPVIVLPVGRSTMENRAAEELAEYLFRITEQRVQIEAEDRVNGRYGIYIGRTVRSLDEGIGKKCQKLKAGGYVIDCNKQRLIVRGKEDLGTFYGVCELLERVGVRWFNPESIGEVVPKAANIWIVECLDSAEPDFEFRWVGSGDWALRNRMNVKVGEEAGIEVDWAAHTWRRYLPAESYYPQYAEYFALVDGSRDVTGQKHREQICTSNEAAAAALITEMRKALGKRPGKKVITLFPNDGFGFCECRNCRGLDEPEWGIGVEEINNHWRQLGDARNHVLSRRMLIHYYGVARDLRISNPDVILQCGHYNAYLLPPQETSIEMPENAVGEICHGICHNHRIVSEECSFNRRFRKGLEGWLKYYSRLSVYEYYYKLAAVELPFPIVHSIRHDIPYYHDLKVYGLYTQFGRNWWTIGLNYYVASKLLWDVQQDVDELLHDFYTKFYGVAWKQMKEFHELFENAASESDLHMLEGFHHWPDVYTNTVLEKANALIREATAMSKDNLVKQRVEKQEIVLEYTGLCMRYIQAIRSICMEEARRKKRFDKDEIRSRLDPYVSSIKSFLKQHKDSNCFGRGISTYQRRFLNPVLATTRVRTSLN